MRNIFFYRITLLLLMIFVSACNTVKLPEEYVSGNVVLTVDKNGTFIPQVQTRVSAKEFVFHSSKDSVEFSVGEPIRIRAENIDFGNYTFKTVITERQTGPDKVILTLERILENTIRLEEKCQTIFWNNPYYTPIVEISNSLDPEQIILTPIFNSNCRRIGYEIRYGSDDRGCKKEAQESLNRFNDCVKNSKNGKSGNDKSKNKTPPARRKNSIEPPRSLSEIIFGI